MTKQKSTKRDLLLSVLSLLMCVSMLIGSTFAWFTDSVTSASNKIQAGTLKIDLELLEKKDDGTTAWNSIKESKAPIFDYELWEPGYTDVKVLKVENEGNLALKWVAKFVSASQLSALADVIDVYVYPSSTELTYPSNRNLTGYVKVGTVAEFVNTIKETTNGTLAAGEVAYLGIALKMQESAGNEYQNLTLGAFDIQLRAIQETAESDSFGPEYDAGLEPVATYVSNPTDLKTAMLERGGYIKLQDNIVVDASTPLQYGSYMFLANGREVTIDLNGHDIIVTEDANLKTNGVFTTANGGTLNVVGKGTVEVKNGKSGIFHAMNKNDQINVYSGTYISNSDNGSDALAIMYTNSGNIDVYGGTFCPLDGVPCANAEDKQGNRLSIVFHEGVLFETDDVQRGDSTRIKIADDCTKEAVNIDGKTWYQVVKGKGVSTTAELVEALKTGGTHIVLQDDVVLSDPITIDKFVTLNLNKKTLTTMGLNFAADATIENGTIISGGHTSLVPHLKATAGILTMNNVTVDVNHHLNANVNWSEATGMEVQNATAILNNCNIKINNVTKAKWVYSYAISLNNADITVNGGSVTATCVAGTAANGSTNPNAISSMGECSVTLNNVDVNAMYYGTTVNGHLTINTTDKSITSANVVDNRGGSHTLNYID